MGRRKQDSRRIDQRAFLLAYRVWVEMRHPHVPDVPDIEAALRTMTTEDLDADLARAQTLIQYGQAVQAAITALRRER